MKLNHKSNQNYRQFLQHNFTDIYKNNSQVYQELIIKVSLDQLRQN